MFKNIINDRGKVKLWSAFIICLFISLLIEVWTRQCGFLMTPDSYNYLSAATSFHQNGKFLSPDGSNYSNWPPLFPVVLSFFDSMPVAAAWIYFFCKLTISIQILLLAKKFLQQLFFRVIYLVTTLLSVHFLLISVFLWSEMIFMMLLLLHLNLAFSIDKKKYNFLLLLITGFLLCLQRNAGVFWVGAIAAWMVLYATPGISFSQRMKRSIFYTIICCSGLALWYVYTIAYLRDLTAFTGGNIFETVFRNIEMILSNLGALFLPVRGVVVIIVGGIMFASIGYFSYRHCKEDDRLKLIALGILFYTIGFLPVTRLDAHDMERYFAVILPLFVIFPVLVIEGLSVRHCNRSLAIRILLILWLSYPLVRVYKNARQWHEKSCGINDSRLQ